MSGKNQKVKTSEEIIFSEDQNFLMAVSLIAILMIFLNLLFLYAIFRQVYIGMPFGDTPMSNTGLFLLFGFTFLITAFLYVLRLETRISKDRIKVRFFPIHRRFNEFKPEAVEQCEVRKYRPIREFGGWGFRYGIGSGGKAWTVSGKYGLQLVFLNGKKLLIGTRKPKGLKNALDKSNFPLKSDKSD